jgi:hypothetical protein
VSGGANRIYTYTPSLTFSTPIGGGVAASTTNFITDILYVAGTSASSVFVNGSSYVTGTVGQFTCSGITVANRFSLNEGFPGHICEVLAFNAGVTTIQRQQIEGYLAWKWGIQSSLVSGHPFRSSSPYQTSKVPYSIGNAVKATLFGQYVFSSTTIAGCQLWMDAADSTTITRSGANITGWNDKANLYTGTATNSPQYNSNPINRLPTIRFDGASSRYVLISANNYNYSTMTYFMVIRWISGSGGFMGTDTPGNYGRALAVSSPNTQLLLYNQFYTTSVALTAGQPCILSAYFNGTTDFTVILNGVKTLFSVAQATGNTNTNGFNIGVFNPTNGGNHSFDMGEGLVYNSILTDTQREQVEGYLAWKWGIQSSLPTSHSYYINSPIYTFPISVTRATTQTWSPLRISGSQIWMDGSDPAGTGAAPANGAIVSSWVDKSGNGNSGTAVGTGAAYSSSQKALLFGSLTASPTGGQTSFPSGNYYTTSYTAAPTFETCFVVFNMPVIGYGFIITSNSCGGRSLATPVFSGSIASFAGGVVCYTWGVTGLASITASTTYIGELISSSGNQTATVNGGTFAGPVSQSYSSGTTTVIGGYGVGNFAYYNGYVYEILFYNSILTTSQRQQVEGYLAWKWGVNTSLPGGHPYINFPPSP